MKVFYAALAAALIVSGSGCTALHQGPGCGDSCGVACGPTCGPSDCGCRSPLANAEFSLRNRCGRLGLCDKLGLGSCGSGPGCGDVACGDCPVDGYGCGPGGCGPDGCAANSCLQRGLGKVLDCNNCPMSGGEGPCGFGRGSDRFYGFNPGPPVGQVGYPYYTVRGPRDFLNPNPRSIGPR